MVELVIDASVVVKWYLEEEFQDRALLLREQYIEGLMELSAPCLMPYEVLNALRYSGVYSGGELERAAESLEAYGIKLYDLRGERKRATLRTAINRDITIYDACYVALALHLKTRLYTADAELIGKIGKRHPEVKHIKELT